MRRSPAGATARFSMREANPAASSAMAPAAATISSPAGVGA